MEEKRGKGVHKIVMEERECISIDGVEEVISFDEESIVCETSRGALVIKGKELHVEKLNLDQGLVAVVGEISSLEYLEEGVFSKKNGGILGRIFR